MCFSPFDSALTNSECVHTLNALNGMDFSLADPVEKCFGLEEFLEQL